MTEEQVTKNGHRVTAMLAGSALTVSTIAIGAPAAFADDDDQQQGVVTAQDQQEAGTQADHTFKLEAKKAKAGDTVGISGDGFTPNGEVTIAMGNEMFVTQQADENGSLEGEFAIPDQFEDGSYDLAVGDSETGNVAYADFKVIDGDDQGDRDDDRGDRDDEVEIDLEPDDVNPGESIQVSGEDFTPGGVVTLSWNPEQNIAADENGNIRTEIAIPADAEVGDQEVTAVDQDTGREDVEDFTVGDDDRDEDDRDDKDDKDDKEEHDDDDRDDDRNDD